MLHVGRVVAEAREMQDWGVHFPAPKIDIDAVRSRKEKVIGALTGGLAQLAKRRNVEVVQGQAIFTASNTIEVVQKDAGSQTLTFDHCILASGSRPARIPAFDIGSPRVMDSTAALQLEDVPDSLLVIGGGYIGLEMGTVYAELGSQVLSGRTYGRSPAWSGSRPCQTTSQKGQGALRSHSFEYKGCWAKGCR